MTIRTPGKFEGQQDYAPYFYDAYLNGFSEEEVEINGVQVSIFTIDQDDADRFPEELGQRVGEKIAFTETDQGFWEEVEVPSEEELEAEGGVDLDTEAVIADAGRRGYSLSIEGRHIDNYSEIADALEAYRKHTQKHQVFYNLYFMSDHGNFWPIDEHGNALKGTTTHGLHGVETLKPADWRHRPVLEQGHTDNLVHDSGKVRVWVSRMTRADGAPEDKQVTIEHLVKGRWVTTAESKGNRWVFTEEGQLNGTKGGAALRLHWFTANNAFGFTYGEQMIRLHHEEMLYPTRAAAVAAAQRHGLKVAKNGLVTTLGGGTPALDGV